MPTEAQWKAARAREGMNRSLRAFFAGRGFLEVETPALVALPGLEPHIDPFAVPFAPQMSVGARRELFLHTSPEYAMKRLLADGCGPIFQIAKVFRNGEISPAHNPEFSLLEFYRPHADYGAIMADLEEALRSVEKQVAPERGIFSKPFERLTARDAVLRETGIDVAKHSEGGSLKEAAERTGIRTQGAERFEDVFFHVFLQKVEPRLGIERPTFLTEYPAPLASLARLKPNDSSVAERVELYVDGAELANGFSELTDSAEQRRRLEEERALRRATGARDIPLDEKFLDAVGRMPPSAGIAVGLDRVLMLLLGASAIEDVLLFPARDFFSDLD